MWCDPGINVFDTVTCMDGRIEPMDALGLGLDDAHVVRNGGGNARDAMRPIVISEQMLGTWELLVIKHTDCGFTYFDNQKAHDTCLKNLGPEAKEELDDMDFGPITDLDEAVRQDVKYLRDSKLIQRDVVVSGWVLDLETGKVRKVE